MSANINKVIQTTSNENAMHDQFDFPAPDAIQKSDEINKKFMREYNRFRISRHRYQSLMPMPDSFPMMCALFEAIKAYLRTLTDQDIYDNNHLIDVPYFGRTWKIEFLSGGLLRRNEVYLSIAWPEPIHTPMAVIGFDIPDHWSF